MRKKVPSFLFSNETHQVRQNFHIILIPLKSVPDLARPLEKESEEETPAQKSFNTKKPKMMDYNKKRSSEKTEPEPGTSSEISSAGRPLDKKVLKALNQVVQEPQVLVENLADTLRKEYPKDQAAPINIEPTGTGTEKSRLCVKIRTSKSRLIRMTQNCLCLISDPNLKDVDEDVATVVGPLMQKHGVGFRQHESEKEQREMEKQRLISKNKGRIEEQMEIICD